MDSTKQKHVVAYKISMNLVIFLTAAYYGAASVV
jgi:hypothetical protein